MEQNLKTLLNEYYTYYRTIKGEPFLSYELFQDADGCSKYCCAIYKSVFKQLCRLFDNLDGNESILSLIDRMCCQEDRIPGDDIVRHGKLEWDRAIDSNLIDFAQFSVVATFTPKYEEDSSTLDSLINILIYKPNSGGHDNGIDSVVEEFLNQYNGNCDTVLIQTNLGYLIYQTFERYQKYSKDRKISYRGIVYSINKQIKTYKGYRENKTEF